ncbi:UDP-N-acetylenolpyruvoylglucosamine reductase [Corynebacterium occultum]|uniref:UDP-N-acetylenolpyruvoylglucosamine reductase n=1 Tax=Corynebacterium occultum TaxID=2675219 RepID=A0A6B8VYB9_9CORY|nr:UDP-N-acetylmuramate dehydrogenase [Corynebacterium occultum]QGU06334.1 UDP-N-acetylenolpyruvoylglucosamine reductase [Corynebacterium occultum]
MSNSSQTPDLAQQLTQIADVSIDHEISFAELTTLHLGGRPRLAVRCATPAAVVAALQLLDRRGVPTLVVGGGSNLLIADGELDLVAVIIECADVMVDVATGLLRAEAGAVWDEVVELSVDSGLGGLECLSGIPGSAGATPVQNVGAYGVEIADVLTRVRLYDRQSGQDHWVPVADLELAYRYSNLKFTGRAVVLEIELQLRVDGLSAPLRFGQLTRALELSETGEHRPAADVRAEVLRLRRSKGMVLEPDDVDTWSAGSFFTNPVVSGTLAEQVRTQVAAERGAEDAAKMPCFPAGEGTFKLSAAWLIDRAGFERGYPGENAPARLSTKHTLALTNRGSATTAELVDLARTIRDGVQHRFGVQLVPEPVWVGVSLD